MHLEYVKRSVSPDSDYDGVTTDVFVRIDTLIKGEPNLGKRHLRFMIEDGTFFSERDDAFITAQVGSQPTYEVRERVMLFLKDGSQDPVYYGKWPYNGLHGNVLIGDYGKLLLDDEGLLEFHYYIDSHSKRVSGVAMRWGLVGVLGQAIVADKEAASWRTRLRGLLSTCRMATTSCQSLLSIGCLMKLRKYSKPQMKKSESTTRWRARGI